MLLVAEAVRVWSLLALRPPARSAHHKLFYNSEDDIVKTFNETTMTLINEADHSEIVVDLKCPGVPLEVVQEPPGLPPLPREAERPARARVGRALRRSLGR